MLKNSHKFYLLLAYIFISASQVFAGSASLNDGDLKDPDNVKISSKLIGRLDWGYDSYYEINLVVDEVEVAQATSIPDQTSDKLQALRAIIERAKTEKKYLIVHTGQFSYSPLESLEVSDLSLPIKADGQNTHCVECDARREREHNTWFSDFLRKLHKDKK